MRNPHFIYHHFGMAARRTDEDGKLPSLLFHSGGFWNNINADDFANFIHKRQRES